MDAKELMIGDWVNFNGSFDKVQEICYIQGSGMCASAAASATLFPIKMELIKPIPLTAEILEKNGFVCRGAWAIPGEDIGIRQDGDEWGLLPHYGLYTSFAFCHIKFVHELQHALRLCGIEHEITL